MIRLLCVAGLLALLPVSGARAQTRQENWDRCKDMKTSDLAIGACTSLIQSGTENTNDLSALFTNRGNAYDAKGDHPRALQDYEVALRLNPSNTNAYYNRAATFLDAGDLDKALADAESAVRIDPRYGAAIAMRGMVARRRGQFAEAAASFEQAFSAGLGLSSPAAEAYVTSERAKNETATKCGDADADLSIGACTSVIKEPKMVKTALAAAHNRRGIAYRAKGDYAAAGRDYSAAIALDASVAVYFSNRSVADIYTGAWAQAEQDLRQALVIAPKSAAAINGQGLLARQRGDYTLALQYFRDALQLTPDNATFISNRGITYLLMNNYDDASRDLNRAIAINPKEAYALFARGVLKRRKGDLTGGDADIAAAKGIRGDIDTEMALRNVKP